jgi:hypothetical protein
LATHSLGDGDVTRPRCRRGRQRSRPTSRRHVNGKANVGSRNVFSLSAHSLGDGDVTRERRRPRRHANGKANGGAGTFSRCPRILRATGTSPGSADVLVGMRMEKPTWEPERLFVVHAFSGRRGRHPGAPTSSSACEWKSRERGRPRRHANGKANVGAEASFRCPRILRATGTSPAPDADGDVSAPGRRPRRHANGKANVGAGMFSPCPPHSPGDGDVTRPRCRRGRQRSRPTSSSACEWKGQRGSRNVFSLSTHSPGDVLVGMRMEKPTGEPERLFVGHAFSGRRPRRHANGKANGGAGTSFRWPRILRATSSSACEWKSQRGSRGVFSLSAHSPGDGDVTRPRCRRGRQRSRPTSRRHVNGKANGGAEASFRWPRILRATGTSPAPDADEDVSAPCRRGGQRSWPTSRSHQFPECE